MSHRFKLQKFLGLTDDEILENEKLWREENPSDGDVAEEDTADFGATGLKGPSDADLDLSGGLDLGPAEGEAGAEGAPEVGAPGSALPPGGAAPAA
jgi:hypothetical protein